MPDTDLTTRLKTAFAGVEIPGGGDLAHFAGLSEIIVTKSAIAAAISITPGMEAAFGPARAEAQRLAEALAEGRKVMISLTADKATAAHSHARQPGPPAKEAVPGVKHIIAVASARAASASRPPRSIWRWPWPRPVSAPACSTPTFTARRSLSCSASRASRPSAPTASSRRIWPMG